MAALDRLRVACIMASMTALSVGALVASCVSVPIDPTANIPILASESADEGDPLPAALSPVASKVAADERAPHRAVAMVISKLSRIERVAGAPILIDVRLDAVDASGEPAPLAGDLRIVSTSSRCEPRHLAFDVALATKRQAEKRYDATLQQYVLRLQPEWDVEPLVGDELNLTATLTALDGSVLEATTRLTW